MCFYVASTTLSSFSFVISSTMTKIEGKRNKKANLFYMDSLFYYYLISLPWTDIATSMSSSWVNSSLRSEEHTSELQSRGHIVCRLLLERKKRRQEHTHPIHHMTTTQPANHR